MYSQLAQHIWGGWLEEPIVLDEGNTMMGLCGINGKYSVFSTYHHGGHFDYVYVPVCGIKGVVVARK